MAKLWKRTHDAAENSQMQEVDMSALVISSPTVIHLTGYLTTDRCNGFIAGGIKSLEELLDG